MKIKALIFSNIIFLPVAASNQFFGDYRNQISFHAGIGTSSGPMTKLIMPNKWSGDGLAFVMAQYSQPAEIFRLPARISLHTAGIFGEYPESIVGISWDVALRAWREFYIGAGLGGFLQSEMNKRVGSRFTFGEKVFIGWRFAERFSAELFTQHFSNGDITPVNHGYNFAGISMLWNF